MNNLTVYISSRGRNRIYGIHRIDPDTWKYLFAPNIWLAWDLEWNWTNTTVLPTINANKIRKLCMLTFWNKKKENTGTTQLVRQHLWKKLQLTFHVQDPSLERRIEPVLMVIPGWVEQREFPRWCKSHCFSLSQLQLRV